MILPETFDVSTVWTVAGGAGGGVTDCDCVVCVGLDGFIGPGIIFGTKPWFNTGVNPPGIEVGGTGWANFTLGIAFDWDNPTFPGCPGW